MCDRRKVNALFFLSRFVVIVFEKKVMVNDNVAFLLPAGVGVFLNGFSNTQ